MYEYWHPPTRGASTYPVRVHCTSICQTIADLHVPLVIDLLKTRLCPYSYFGWEGCTRAITHNQSTHSPHSPHFTFFFFPQCTPLRRCAWLVGTPPLCRKMPGDPRMGEVPFSPQVHSPPLGASPAQPKTANPMDSFFWAGEVWVGGCDSVCYGRTGAIPKKVDCTDRIGGEEGYDLSDFSHFWFRL